MRSLFLPSPSSPPQVLTKVDVVFEKEMLHLYVLSGIGGLVLLVLIFLALYKVGASRGLRTAKTAGAKGVWGRWQGPGRSMPGQGGEEAEQASAHPILPRLGL